MQTESPYLQRTSCTYPEEISHTKMLLFSTEVFVSDIYNVNVPLIYTIFTWMQHKPDLRQPSKQHICQGKMYSFKSKATCWDIFCQELDIVNAQNISESIFFYQLVSTSPSTMPAFTTGAFTFLTLSAITSSLFTVIQQHIRSIHCTGYTTVFKLPHSCFWRDPYHAMNMH